MACRHWPVVRCLAPALCSAASVARRVRSLSRERACERPPNCLAGYCAWGCFRYLGPRAAVARGPSRIAARLSREKYFASVFRKYVLAFRSSRPTARGVSRSSRTRGGLWWTRRCRVRKVIAGRAKLVSGCGVRDELQCRGRRSRVVLAPHGRRQGSLLLRGARPGWEARQQRTDGVNTANGPRGEREGHRKTIAWGMPDVSGASAVNTCVLVFLLSHTAHRAAGASSTRHSPRPWFRRARVQGITSGRAAPASVKACHAPSSSAKADDPVIRDVSD